LSKSAPSRLEMMFPRREIQAYREWLCFGYICLGMGVLRLVGELVFASGLVDTGNNMPPQIIIFWRELLQGSGSLFVFGVLDYAIDLVLSGLLSALVLWRALFVPAPAKIRIYFLCLSLCITPGFVFCPLVIRYSSPFQPLLLAFLWVALSTVGTLSFRSGVKDFIKHKLGR